MGRTYLFWTPHPWLALKAEYLFERFKREGLTAQMELDTHRFPLGIKLFHPSGWSASLTTTYWNQDVKLESSRSGRDDFWTVNAGISYRLLKRYGFIMLDTINLFNKRFNYFDIDTQNPIIEPARTVFFRVMLALP